jgi:hypothetical protein
MALDAAQPWKLKSYKAHWLPNVPSALTCYHSVHTSVFRMSVTKSALAINHIGLCIGDVTCFL